MYLIVNQIPLKRGTLMDLPVHLFIAPGPFIWSALSLSIAADIVRPVVVLFLASLTRAGAKATRLFEKWNRLKWRHLLNVWGNRPLFIRFLRQMARISKFFQNSFKTKMASFTLIPKSLVESVSFGDWKAGELVASSLKVWTEYRSSTNCRSLTKYGYLAKYRSLAKYRCLTKRRLLIKFLTN